jgi:hypothetical protein
VRKKLAVLVAAAMMLVMAVGPAWAAPGGNLNGKGDGVGGGDIANPDTGNHSAVGGGRLNNPNVCGIGCGG